MRQRDDGLLGGHSADPALVQGGQEGVLGMSHGPGRRDQRLAEGAVPAPRLGMPALSFWPGAKLAQAAR